MTQTLDAVLAKGQTMPEKNRFPAVMQPSLYESHPQDCRVTGPVEQCPTVSAKWGTGGNNTPLVTDGEAIGFAENFDAIDLTQTAPAMTTSGYRPTQNAGGLGALQYSQLVTDGGTHFRKSKRAQSMDDDETWVESEVTNTMNVFDQGDVRATDVVVQPGEALPLAYDDRSQAVSTDTHHTLRGESAVSRTSDAIVQSGGASAFSWQCRGDMRGMVPRPTAQLQRCQIEAVMVQPFAQNQLGEVRAGEVFNTINTNSNASGRNTPLVQTAMHVRRLTPVECERLQGFPDGWTDIRPNGKDTPDSPRYKALGNSMAVPVMRWIGMRIAETSRG